MILTEPLKPDPPTVSVDMSTGKVKIDVTPPDNGGATITAYKVTIKGKDGTYYEYKDTCDGSHEDFVKTPECEIQMSVFWVAPFNLVAGDDILTKVSATNTMGTGPENDEDNAPDE